MNKRERKEFRTEIKIAEERMKRHKKNMWDPCRDFYKGKHKPDSWQGRDSDFITVNLIFSNIVSQMPYLTFEAPKFQATPAESAYLDSSEKLRKAEKKADIVAAKLNHERKKQEFRRHFELGVLDAFFAFGCFKVFHRVNTRKNPNAGDPKTHDDGTPITDDEGNIQLQPDVVPAHTEFVVNRVKPENFLIDPHAGNLISSAKWVAERIPMRTSEAREMLGDRNIEPIGKVEADKKGILDKMKSLFSNNKSEDDEFESLDVSVVYEVWDRKENRVFYMVHGIDDKVYKERPIPKDYRKTPNKTPYCLLKYYEVPDEFYPIPDVFPQLPLNLSYDLSRSQINQYRKQAIAKVLVQKGAIDEHEMQKFQSNKAFEMIKTETNPNQENPLSFIDPPSIPAGVFEHLQIDQQDLRKMSGVTQEMQGTQDQQQLATQSLLANEAAQDKAGWKQRKIGDVANDIGRKMLTLMQNRIKRGGTIKMVSDTGEKYQEYKPDDLEGKFEIDVEYGSGIPENEAAQRDRFMQAMSIVAENPNLLQWFDEQKLAEQFTRFFPVAKSSLRDEANQQVLEQHSPGEEGGGTAGMDELQRAFGGQAGPGPEPGQQGLRTTQRNMMGGMGG